MADGIEITFEGMPEFSRMMQDLAGPTIDKIARAAVRNGGRVMQQAITDAAPVRDDHPSGTALPPGALKNDIELKVRKEQDGSISAYIAPGKYTRRQAMWREYGFDLVKGGWSKQGAGILGQGRRGPGRVIKRVGAKPWIRPAFEANAGAAEDAMAMTIAQAFAGGSGVTVPDEVPESESGE